MPVIREIGASLRDLITRLSAKSSTITGAEFVYIDDAGTSLKANLANIIRYGGGSPRNTTAGNATVTQTTDGALYLEVAGQTAGNARGAGAFDWQATRTNAVQVASGANAFSFGSNCIANAPCAVGIGNYAQALAQSAIALGDNVFALGYASVAMTNNALATNRGQIAWGASGAAGVGCAQGNLQAFYTVTTNAESTTLNIYNEDISGRMLISPTRSCAFIGIVQAMCNVSSSSNLIKAWKIEGVITRDGSNNTRIVGTPTITEIAKDSDGTPTPSTWAIASITADDTNKALAINVTGQAATTIRWQATLMYSQVGF